MLQDWAAYLDTVRITDWHVGQVMKRLKKEGILENTLVVFFTDHGITHARGKQFLYDEAGQFARDQYFLREKMKAEVLMDIEQKANEITEQSVRQSSDVG